MAVLTVDSDHVTVGLEGIERLGTLHDSVTVLRADVTHARVVDEPFAEIRGIRAPGVAWPRRIAIGRWRRGRGKDLVVVRRGERAVLIELGGGARYRRLLVGAPDPDAVVAELSAAPSVG